jgi:hypothetical protein
LRGCALTRLGRDACAAANTPGFEVVAQWYEKVRWWAVLKRAGVPEQWS